MKGKDKRMTTMKDALLDCEKIIDDIMDKVDNKLSENNVDFIHKNKSEIIVENTDKNSILGMLTTIDELDERQSKILLQVTESNNRVFIRQKFN